MTEAGNLNLSVAIDNYETDFEESMREEEEVPVEGLEPVETAEVAEVDTVALWGRVAAQMNRLAIDSAEELSLMIKIHDKWLQRQMAKPKVWKDLSEKARNRISELQKWLADDKYRGNTEVPDTHVMFAKVREEVEVLESRKSSSMIKKYTERLNEMQAAKGTDHVVTVPYQFIYTMLTKGRIIVYDGLKKRGPKYAQLLEEFLKIPFEDRFPSQEDGDEIRVSRKRKGGRKRKVVVEDVEENERCEEAEDGDDEAEEEPGHSEELYDIKKIQDRVQKKLRDESLSTSSLGRLIKIPSGTLSGMLRKKRKWSQITEDQRKRFFKLLRWLASVGDKREGDPDFDDIEFLNYTTENDEYDSSQDSMLDMTIGLEDDCDPPFTGKKRRLNSETTDDEMPVDEPQKDQEDMEEVLGAPQQAKENPLEERQDEEQQPMLDDFEDPMPVLEPEAEIENDAQEMNVMGTWEHLQDVPPEIQMEDENTAPISQRTEVEKEKMGIPRDSKPLGDASNREVAGNRRHMSIQGGTHRRGTSASRKLLVNKTPMREMAANQEVRGQSGIQEETAYPTIPLPIDDAFNKGMTVNQEDHPQVAIQGATALPRPSGSRIPIRNNTPVCLVKESISKIFGAPRSLRSVVVTPGPSKVIDANVGEQAVVNGARQRNDVAPPQIEAPTALVVQQQEAALASQPLMKFSISELIGQEEVRRQSAIQAGTAYPTLLSLKSTSSRKSAPIFPAPQILREQAQQHGAPTTTQSHSVVEKEPKPFGDAPNRELVRNQEARRHSSVQGETSLSRNPLPLGAAALKRGFSVGEDGRRHSTILEGTASPRPSTSMNTPTRRNAVSRPVSESKNNGPVKPEIPSNTYANVRMHIPMNVVSQMIQASPAQIETPVRPREQMQQRVAATITGRKSLGVGPSAEEKPIPPTKSSHTVVKVEPPSDDYEGTQNIEASQQVQAALAPAPAPSALQVQQPQQTIAAQPRREEVPPKTEALQQAQTAPVPTPQTIQEQLPQPAMVAQSRMEVPPNIVAPQQVQAVPVPAPPAVPQLPQPAIVPQHRGEVPPSNEAPVQADPAPAPPSFHQHLRAVDAAQARKDLFAAHVCLTIPVHTLDTVSKIMYIVKGRGKSTAKEGNCLCTTGTLEEINEIIEDLMKENLSHGMLIKGIPNQ